MSIGIGIGLTHPHGIGAGGVKTVWPNKNATIAYRSDNLLTDGGTKVITLYDGAGTNDATASAAAKRPNYVTSSGPSGTIDAWKGQAGAGLDLTLNATLNITGMYDLFVVTYNSNNRELFFPVNTNWQITPLNLDSNQSFAGTGAAIRISNTTTTGAWKCYRATRAADNKVRLYQNGVDISEGTPPTIAGTIAADVLMSNTWPGSDGPTCEVFMLVGGVWSGGDLTSAYTYINNRYPSLLVTIP